MWFVAYEIRGIINRRCGSYSAVEPKNIFAQQLYTYYRPCCGFDLDSTHVAFCGLPCAMEVG